MSTSTPTFVDLGVHCTAIADMPDFSECSSVYVTSLPASTATTAAKVTRSVAATGIFSDIGAGKNGHASYVVMGMIAAIAALSIVLGLLTYCICVRHHKRKAGGK